MRHVDVDWNEQAAKAAENYLDVMPFTEVLASSAWTNPSTPRGRNPFNGLTKSRTH